MHSFSQDASYLQDLAGEQESVHHLGLEELPDVEDLLRVVHPDQDLQGGQQGLPHARLSTPPTHKHDADTRAHMVSHGASTQPRHMQCTSL